MVGCWMWHMKMLCVCLVCWTPASGRNTPWLDCYDNGLQRSSQSMCCSLKHEKHESGVWGNVALYRKIRTNTSSGWRHYQNTRWQDDLQASLNLIIHTRHFSSLPHSCAHYIIFHVCELKPTWIHGFIPSLHNGPVDAWHQPRACHNTAQQPQNAVADAHDDIVEKEEVIEAVECLSEEEESNT